MSGPPPCTITGLSPQYLSRTTSVAKPSRSSSSRMAAPPAACGRWRSGLRRSYRAPPAQDAKRRSRRIYSCRVLRVDSYVLGGQVREVDMSGAVAALQAQRDLRLGGVGGELVGLDRLGPQFGELGPGQRDPGRLGDPAPVAVAPGEGRLDQRR